MDDTVTPPSAMRLGQGLIRLMRPKQWVKNGFVLAPLVFSGHFLNTNAVVQAFIAVALFCLASSATYIINDIQ
ncbi:MAG: decaprenyl-phosphate phosphoribosyltransferase, partial [Hydrogenophaga sp.]